MVYSNLYYVGMGIWLKVLLLAVMALEFQTDVLIISFSLSVFWNHDKCLFLKNWVWVSVMPLLVFESVCVCVCVCACARVWDSTSSKRCFKNHLAQPWNAKRKQKLGSTDQLAKKTFLNCSLPFVCFRNLRSDSVRLQFDFLSIVTVPDENLLDKNKLCNTANTSNSDNTTASSKLTVSLGHGRF